MRTVFYTLGLSLLLYAGIMLIPFFMELIYPTKDWEVFALSAFFTAFFGGAMVIMNRTEKHTLSVRHAYLLTSSLWIVFAVCGALPFYFTTSEYHLSFTDAVFETVSGLTTTGSTVITGLETAPGGLLLWRSLLQGIGGVGIVVFAMVIFPYLGIGGMQLFQSESSEKSDKILPKAQQVAGVVVVVYLILIIANIIAYYLAGMTFFDAFNHALPTISTGGFSTHDNSFGHYNDDPLIFWISSIFMMLGGSPLLFFAYVLLRQRPDPILTLQTSMFWGAMALICVFVAVWVMWYTHMGFWHTLTVVTFNLVSIVTTTGFISGDYMKWGSFFVMVVYYLTVIGGCTGSTAGGLKIYRMQIMSKMMLREAKKIVAPLYTTNVQLGGRVINSSIQHGVSIFFFVFITVFAISVILLSLCGLGFLEALSATATAMGNVGPGLGDIIGPVGTFKPLPDPAIWILTFDMLIGRLEFFTILVLLYRPFWVELSR